jgi:prepilin-type N-terminal cleavage/methylation domain-containing protein
MSTKKIRKPKGFTLIEIAIVIGLIAVLAATAIVAINPARQFKLARNSQRISNVSAILNAVGERISDNHGTFEGTVAGTSQTCPSLAAGTDYAVAKGPTSASGALDLSCLSPAYIPSLPSDPKASAPDTGYVLNLDENDRVTVKAPLAEIGVTIEAGR